MNCLQLYLLAHNLSPSLSMHINVSKVSPPALLGPKDEKALTSLVALNLWPFQWLTSQTSPEALSSLLTACEGPRVQPVRKMIQKGHLWGFDVTMVGRNSLKRNWGLQIWRVAIKKKPSSVTYSSRILQALKWNMREGMMFVAVCSISTKGTYELIHQYSNGLVRSSKSSHSQNKAFWVAGFRLSTSWDITLCMPT